MSPTQAAELKKHRLRFDMHINYEDKTVKRLVNDELGVVAEYVTPKFGVKNGIASTYGRTTVTYYIKGIEGHFNDVLTMGEKLAEMGRLGQ